MLQFIKDNKKTILYALLGLVVLFIVYKIYKKLTEDTDPNSNLLDIASGGIVSNDFNPEIWAREFENQFIGISFDLEGRMDLLKRMNDLNDNSLITVSNYWNENYSSKTVGPFGLGRYGTMYSVIDSEWGPLLSYGDDVNYFTVMKDRLARLTMNR